MFTGNVPWKDVLSFLIEATVVFGWVFFIYFIIESSMKGRKKRPTPPQTKKVERDYDST